MSTPASPLLSPSQLTALAQFGEERSANVGELLYEVGDRIYPFIAILEGEVAIIDAAGNELVRHGPSGFLGELNLMSGQTVFVNALVVEPASPAVTSVAATTHPTGTPLRMPTTRRTRSSARSSPGRIGAFSV